MNQELQDKRRHVPTRGRGVTAAQRAFTSFSGGSNPPGPIELPRDQGVSGSTLGSYPSR